ncbi:MAG TPA: hypothetical protein QF353_06475 [Gammaproteobacteria bacterium]|nr:hypothetical protein [Gammaproteobacteria bacterium]
MIKNPTLYHCATQPSHDINSNLYRLLERSSENSEEMVYAMINTIREHYNTLNQDLLFSSLHYIMSNIENGRTIFHYAFDQIGSLLFDGYNVDSNRRRDEFITMLDEGSQQSSKRYFTCYEIIKKAKSYLEENKNSIQSEIDRKIHRIAYHNTACHLLRTHSAPLDELLEHAWYLQDNSTMLLGLLSKIKDHSISKGPQVKLFLTLLTTYKNNNSTPNSQDIAKLSHKIHLDQRQANPETLSKLLEETFTPIPIHDVDNSPISSTALRTPTPLRVPSKSPSNNTSASTTPFDSRNNSPFSQFGRTPSPFMVTTIGRASAFISKNSAFAPQLTQSSDNH